MKEREKRNEIDKEIRKQKVNETKNQAQVGIVTYVSSAFCILRGFIKNSLFIYF